MKNKLKHSSKYQLDQSGKIEDTSKNTVLAISNGTTCSILLKAKHKRLLQQIYRQSENKNRQFIYEVFSALLFILIDLSQPETTISVDIEYPGHNDLIKLHYLSHSKNLPDLKFALIGKSSPAHSLAYLTFKKKLTPSKIVSFEEVFLLLFNQQKRSSISLLTKPRALKHRIKRRVSSHPDL